MLTILQGDCREVLKTLPDESVHCCVTSPPYWGLRDYGVDGQIGLEPTPEAYVEQIVAVFREVRRVLRSDGTLWLNLGDSFAGHNLPGWREGNEVKNGGMSNKNGVGFVSGCKPKDLVGIPWLVARALQQPYYTGKIKRIEDRVWLAAMIDGEGCMFVHKRKIGQSNGQGYVRKNDSYGAGLEVANCHESIVRRCMEITGLGSICYQDKESKLKNRNQRLYRWNLRSNECRKVIQEIYPFLVGKQHEARLLLSCPSSGPDAEKAHASLIKLHNGFDATIDFPAPPSMYEQGYWLRSDIIWHKSNPMPESVTDRPTKAHEYLFLLAKSQSYYYDAEAIREPHMDSSLRRYEYGGNGANGAPYSMQQSPRGSDGGRNKRSVWTVTTSPYSDAHFATFPPKLIKPCVLAGCPAGGTVLDPFGGSGTTGKVALELGRKAILIELNPAYCKMMDKRAEVTLGFNFDH